jgi:hypothetical protein
LVPRSPLVTHSPPILPIPRHCDFFPSASSSCKLFFLVMDLGVHLSSSPSSSRICSRRSFASPSSQQTLSCPSSSQVHFARVSILVHPRCCTCRVVRRSCSKIRSSPLSISTHRTSPAQIPFYDSLGHASPPHRLAALLASASTTPSICGSPFTLL